MKKGLQKGIFFAVSAPSGTGKTTICKRILSELNGLVRSLSVTTRGKREGEREGADYIFVDQETFRKMQDRGELYEWQEIHGYFYGTPRGPLEEAMRAGKDVLFDIDTRGALTIKQDFPEESCLIFLRPPSHDVLEQRLKGRKTERDESLRRRLTAAEQELRQQDLFDYVIINDNLEEAVREIHAIIERERSKRN